MSDVVAVTAVICLAVVTIVSVVGLALIAKYLLTERDHLIVREPKDLALIERARQPKPPARAVLDPMDMEYLAHAAATGEVPPYEDTPMPDGLGG